MNLECDLVTNFAELEAIAQDWLDLLERSEASEPTMTPSWQKAWWRTFGARDGRELRAVVVRQGGRLVGLAPFVRRGRRLPLGVSVRRVELTASGEDEADEICSDYIGVLAERGRERDVARGVCRALASGALGAWDELVLSAMDGQKLMPFCMCEELRSHGYATVCEQTSIAPYVPLPASWDEYLAQLPSSRRYFVRRTLRDFDAWAGRDVRVERVREPSDLTRALATLIALHEERWRSEGSEGVFRSERFAAFHRAVMPELLERGALDLGILLVKDEPIAAAYNIVHDGKVYFYQSGRKLTLPAKIRAGVVWHALAIRRAIEDGHREYDFLAGASRYKLTLALRARPIVRVRAVRPVWLEAAAALSGCARRSFRTSLHGSPAPLLREEPTPVPAD